MVLKLFVGNRPIVLLFLPVIISIMVGINLFFDYYSYADTINLGLWGNGFEWPLWLTGILGPLLVLVNSILLSTLFNSHSLLDRNTYVTSLIYVIYFSYYHSFYQLDGLIIAHLFLIASLFQLFRLHQNEDGRKAVFNAGFFTGLAMTFHPASVVFFPFVYFSVVVIRPFLLRELGLLLAGFVVPLIYAFLNNYFFGGWKESEITWRLLEYSTSYAKIQLDFLVTATLFVLTIILSFLALGGQAQSTGIRAKKLNRMLLWMSIASFILGSYDYIRFGQIERFSLLLIPVSVFLTFAFTSKRYQYITNGFFYLVLIYSLVKLFL
jgi:hypothetical protein